MAILTALALCLAPQVVHAAELQTLAGGDGPFVLNRDYGFAVALDDDLLVVGAPDQKYDEQQITGLVHVYRAAPGGPWVEEAIVEIAPPGPETGGRLGESLDIEGTRVLAGAPQLELTEFSEGGVYVLERNPFGEWPAVALLALEDPLENARLGNSVDLDGERALVGAQIGDAHVFERQPDGTWELAASLPVPGPVCGDVALAGDTAVCVAAPVSPGGWRPIVFERQGDGTWVQTAEIPDPGGLYAASYYTRVALEGDRLAVGWWNYTAPLFQSGLVTVHEREPGGAWTLAAALVPPDPQVDEGLGTEIALRGDRIVATAPRGDGAAVDSGRAVVFERGADGAWSAVGQLWLAEGAAGTEFGAAIALDGDTCVVGAPNEGAPAPIVPPGRAHAFTLAPLAGAPAALSLAAGGAQALALVAGPSQAGRPYLVAGSASGTAPGIDVAGPYAVPLVLDPYCLASVGGANHPPFLATFGLLDAAGAASASIALPPGLDPALAGMELHHAAVVLHPVTAAITSITNAVPLALGS